MPQLDVVVPKQIHTANEIKLLGTTSTYSVRCPYPVGDTAKAAITAFGRHLWYLSEHLIGFSCFDESIKKKRMMVVALKGKDGSDEPLKAIPPFLEPIAKQSHDFVTNQ